MPFRRSTASAARTKTLRPSLQILTLDVDNRDVHPIGDLRKAATQLEAILDVHEQDSWTQCHFSLLFAPGNAPSVV